jgi:hypothetical protein
MDDLTWLDHSGFLGWLTEYRTFKYVAIPDRTLLRSASRANSNIVKHHRLKWYHITNLKTCV